MSNQEREQTISREGIKEHLKNRVIPNLERKALLEIVKFLQESWISAELNNLWIYKPRDSMDQTITNLGGVYASYATTLEKRDQIIEYMDKSLTLYPEGSLPLGSQFVEKRGILGFTNTGIHLESQVSIIAYEAPHEDRERLLTMFETRRGKVNN
ncbi:MAG: hypothetical protein AABX03_03885, partial [Nanoarchaeota archaeon]